MSPDSLPVHSPPPASLASLAPRSRRALFRGAGGALASWALAELAGGHAPSARADGTPAVGGLAGGGDRGPHEVEGGVEVDGQLRPMYSIIYSMLYYI